MIRRNFIHALAACAVFAFGSAPAMAEKAKLGVVIQVSDGDPKIGYVKAGVIEIIEKSRQGWSVVRP